MLRFVLALLILPWAAVVILLAAPSARAELLVGVAAPLTGQYAWSGEQTEQGVRLALEDVNAAGGLLGQSVTMIAVDDYCEPQQAVVAARKLLAEGVLVVVGAIAHGAPP